MFKHALVNAEVFHHQSMLMYGPSDHVDMTLMQTI